MSVTTRLTRWLNGRLRTDRWSGWANSAYQKHSFQARLRLVQRHLSERLDNALPGKVLVLSLFAGDGRDVLEVLAAHRRKCDTRALLIEQSSHSVATGSRRAVEIGLADAVTFLNRDATDYEMLQSIPPADIVLLCGVWGHVPCAQRQSLVQALTTLCTPGGAVIWTRGIAKGKAQFQQIKELFAQAQWEKMRVDFSACNKWVVATHRYIGNTIPRPTHGRIFRFTTCAGTR